ncbi:proteoglycan 4-like [Chironomus tepperi]|uniref:proteoglycan 4-like n=1 Tax=Chironomus tepperi TaxID=113505 RepID=UPI00391F495C
MMKMLYRILLLSWCMLMTALALPIESKPLNNNPESWNLSWLVFTPRNSSDPSAEALVSSDPHVKKSKITPKSIFIAPSAYNNHDRLCPHGYRIDDNGKCIKTVTINQDDILAARLTDLFGIDENSDKNGNTDSDYDYDEDKNENSGPLQINLPLAIDIQEETNNGKKVEYIIEEKVINMRNLDPKNAKPVKAEEIKKIEPAPVSEKLFSNDLPATPEITTTTEIPIDDLTTTTQKTYETSTDKSVKSDINDVTTTTINESDSENTVTTESTTIQTTTTTTTPVTTTSEQTTIRTTTEKTKIVSNKPESYKINSVDFMPKITQRKTNRNRVKNSRTRKPKPIIQQQLSQSNDSQVILKSHSIDQLPIPKKNRTRNGMKRRKQSTIKASTSTTTTTTTTTTEIPVATHKPHYWLPKGWSIDETTKEKPVLIRFWSEQPSPHEERARSHNSRHQRVNSRMPTESIFKEITAPELESMLKEN